VRNTIGVGRSAPGKELLTAMTMGKNCTEIGQLFNSGPFIYQIAGYGDTAPRPKTTSSTARRSKTFSIRILESNCNNVSISKAAKAQSRPCRSTAKPQERVREKLLDGTDGRGSSTEIGMDSQREQQGKWGEKVVRETGPHRGGRVPKIQVGNARGRVEEIQKGKHWMVVVTCVSIEISRKNFPPGVRGVRSTVIGRARIKAGPRGDINGRRGEGGERKPVTGQRADMQKQVKSRQQPA